MRRRRFVQTLLATPAVPAVLHAQETKPQQQPVPQPNTPAVQVPRQPPSVAPLQTVEVDLLGVPDQRFFTADQFAGLRKLGAVLMPPLGGGPGALEAQAPEFLDFLLGVSPGDRQKLYRNGLDGLNARAKKHFGKPFAELNDADVDAVIRPLLVARPWPEDLPKDPMENFMAQVHEDLRRATVNSREWAATHANTGRRGRGSGSASGYYWHPIDPVVRG